MAEAGKRKWTWLRRTLKILLVLVVLFGVCRGALYLYAWKVVNDLHAKGWALTPDELEALYPQPPPGQDAAPLYLKAFDELSRVGPIKPRTPIEKYSKALELLHQAADLAGCRFPGDVPLPKASSLESMDYYGSEFGNASALLYVEAHTCAEAGEVTRAVDAVRAELALARACGLKPTFAGQKVFCTATRNAVELLGDVFAFGDVPEDSLDALDKMLASMQSTGSLKRTYQSAIPAGQAMLDDRRGYVRTLIWRSRIRTKIDILSAAIPLPWEKIMALRWLERIEAISEMPCAKRGNAQAALDADFSRRYSGPFASEAFVRLNRPLQDDVRKENALLIGRAAVAVERYWQKNAALPKDLKELVPEFLPEEPIDCLLGRPFPYARLDATGKAYSIGDADMAYALDMPQSQRTAFIRVDKEGYLRFREQMRANGIWAP